MKASVDVVLFIMTVYDYFFNKETKADEPQPDNPYHADMEQDTSNTRISLLGGDSDGFVKFKSMGETRPKRTLFAFEEEKEEDREEEKQPSAYYHRLANDELEQWQKDKENQASVIYGVRSRIGSIWNGASEIMTRYAKRRNELNRQTVESSETL